MKDILGLKTTIRTRDLESAREFYEGLLQLEIYQEYDDGDGSKGVIFRLGESSNQAYLEISEILESHDYYQPAFSQKVENDKMDLQIPCSGIDDWAKKMAEHNWPSRGPVPRPWGSRYLYLRDPDGLQIILFEES